MGGPSRRRFDLVENYRVLYLIKHFVIKRRLSTIRSVVNELRMSPNRNGAITVTIEGEDIIYTSQWLQCLDVV